MADTDLEIAQVADRFGLGRVIGVSRREQGANSQVALFESELGAFCAKGKDPAWRPKSRIEREHEIVDHLLARGFPTPALRRTLQGESVCELGNHLWSVGDQAMGDDRYAHDSVFAPFASEREVFSAGATLARFHRAMADFPVPLPPPATGLSCRFNLALAPDLRNGLPHALTPAALAFVRGRGGLDQALDLFDHLRTGLPERVPDLPGGIVHGDWIKRNLFFMGSEVSAAIDFDLASSGCWAFDLALAISAAAYPWGDLETGIHPRHAVAMREGYASVRSLEPAELAALPALLATCRFEFHLSLIDLLLDRGDLDRAAWVWQGEVATLKWWAAQSGPLPEIPR